MSRIILFALIVAPNAFAHHGDVIFDLESVVTLQGTVSRYLWRNPHVYIYIEARDETGQLAEWQLEGDPTPIMTRSGWTSARVTLGEPVTVRMNSDRDAKRRHALLLSLRKADGMLLMPRILCWLRSSV